MRRASTLLLIASLFAGSSLSAIAAQQKPSQSGPDHKGTAIVTLKFIKALAPNGSPDPAHLKDCIAKYRALLGKKVVTTYDINTQTLIMSATSTFQGKPYNLNALGLANVYAFGVFGVSAEIYSVGFEISHQFTNAASSLGMNLTPGTPGGDTCVVSSNRQ